MVSLGQAVSADALRSLGSFDPVTDALSSGFEFTSELLGSAARADQFDDALAVFGWIGRM